MWLKYFVTSTVYTADIAGETRKALDALRTDPAHWRRDHDFAAGMVYGEKLDFEAALGTVVVLAENAMLQVENGAR